MRPPWPALISALVFLSPLLAAGDLAQQVVSIDYAKGPGLAAAAYQRGQVVVWEVESGRVMNVYHAAGPGTTWNKPLAHFSPDGRRLAFTAEGEAGLQVVDLASGASTAIVPHRLLYRGIAAFAWSHLKDVLLVAIGRDIALFSATGHLEWQRRLETRSLITDIVWHPSEKLYTVATDDTVVSSYETISGRVAGSATLQRISHPVEAKVSWTPDGSALAAGVLGGSLTLLDPETLQIVKSIAGNCTGFDWSPAHDELAASIASNIAVFTVSGQHTRDIHTQFDGSSPVLWADEGRFLTANGDSSVVLREARSGKIIRTFLPSGEKEAPARQAAR